MANRANLILIGFMGSGKSSVGRLLAKRLAYTFVDTDQLITQRAQRDIATIFAEEGEEYFRDLETETLRSMSGLEYCVIATGGGVVVKERNHALLREMGLVVCLTADPATIFERVSRNTKRPLLQTPDPYATMTALLAARQSLYAAAAELTVDGSALSHEEVTERIIQESRAFLSGSPFVA